MSLTKMELENSLRRVDYVQRIQDGLKGINITDKNLDLETKLLEIFSQDIVKGDLKLFKRDYPADYGDYFPA